jgi:hypothetical protein
MPFHLFPDLPPEIRLQIWEATLPGPRPVGPLIPEPRLSMRKRRGPYQDDPVALKVNKESREIALLNYTRRDPSHLKFWEIRDDVKYCSYVDFKVDIAFFYDFDLWGLPPGPYDDAGCQFFSEVEMGRMERLWVVHDGAVNLGRDLARWFDTWLKRLLGLKEMVIEVRGLKKCRGIAAPGGAFQTVEEALQNVKDMGVERLLRFQEELGEKGVKWEMPVLEVEDGENLIFERRLGG